MKPYSGNKKHGAVCKHGCCFAKAKFQPHYRAPDSDEKRGSRRRARAQARAEIFATVADLDG